ncbi:GntR family transcriptional regulator [Streptomyces sp. OF3]|uniref:GntR family transcriptional regulator n=1 Tax=Streptomyces alkaliterrae TaxID=2213162 RepID=A0A7W3WLF4_9ACTN|nr:GntR family transcriptional regulator [Streptomyces alkaliterrae]MBB1254467.1 GntR family transcriptional regulator [Streptomyces alkaliterrae]
MPEEATGHSDPRSLHERIAADLRDDIMRGDLPPGGKMPTTAQLTERFSASNATVQKALRLLKDEGLVVGRAGSSVTVRERRQQLVRPAAYLAPAAPGEPLPWISKNSGDGRRPSSRLLEVAEVTPPTDVSQALALPLGGQALLRAQILSIDEEPVELVQSYYPLELARGTALTELRKIRGGSPALLAGLGHPPRSSVDRVSARIPTQEQYTALKLPGDLPVLRTLRVVRSDAPRPIEVTVMVKAGHLYELEYEFTSE